MELEFADDAYIVTLRTEALGVWLKYLSEFFSGDPPVRAYPVETAVTAIETAAMNIASFWGHEEEIVAAPVRELRLILR